MRFINNTADRIIEISGKKLHNYGGNYEKYQIEKQARYDRQLRDYEMQQKEIAEEQAWIDRFRAQATKAKSVQSRIKALEKLDRIEKPENESTVRNILIQSNRRLPEKVMKIESLVVGYKSINNRQSTMNN